MSVKNFALSVTGWEGLGTSIVPLKCDNTLAEVTTAGFLNPKMLGGTISEDQVVLMKYADGIAFFSVSLTDGVITLSPQSAIVDLPTVPNAIAVFSDTHGTLVSGAANASNPEGNIIAGENKTAGVLRSYAATDATGYSEFKHTANSGDYVTTYTNAAMGQASTITTPDPGAASAVNLIATGSLTNDHLVKTSGTAGKLIDAGVYGTAANRTATTSAGTTPYVASVLQSPTPVVSAVATFQDTTGTIGYFTGMFRAQVGSTAGGTPATVTDANITTSHIIVANFKTQASNAVIRKIVPQAGSFDIHCDADPGASTVHYIALLAQ